MEHLRSGCVLSRKCLFWCTSSALLLPESFLLSSPTNECQIKWEGIKLAASHRAWIIAVWRGHGIFWRVHGHAFDFPVSSSGVLLEFDALLSLYDSAPWRQTVQGEHRGAVYMHASYQRLPNGPSLSSEASSAALKPTSPSVISDVHLPQ